MPRPHRQSRPLPLRLAATALVAAWTATAGAAAGAEPPRGAPLAAQTAAFQGFHSLFHVAPPPPRPAAPALSAAVAPGAGGPGNSCLAAISAAEMRYGIPAGLLQAIGLVETGRHDAASGTRKPWPWAANAEGRGQMFATRAQAIAWVRGQQQAGIRSIDVGCLQVNLAFHPDAFASLDQGFDPAANADYAARFLRRLKEGPGGGDWMVAAGFYHSQTRDRADAYRARVQAALGGRLPGAAPAGTRLAAAGGGGQMLDNGAATAARLPAAPGTIGRGLDAYRRQPVPLALVVPGLRLAAQVSAGARR